MRSPMAVSTFQTNGAWPCCGTHGWTWSAAITPVKPGLLGGDGVVRDLDRPELLEHRGVPDVGAVIRVLPKSCSASSSSIRSSEAPTVRKWWVSQSTARSASFDATSCTSLRWLSLFLSDTRIILANRSSTIRFEGDHENWNDAARQCSGYDADDILDKVLNAALKVKRGEAVHERDSVLFDEIEYAWPVLAGLMWAAARNGGKLNVLDFGGSLGSSYFQNRKFLQTLPEVCWNVVDQPQIVEAGQAYIQDGELNFIKPSRNAWRENQPNVILLSGVLQYLERTGETLSTRLPASA